jgi:hypothetical protein
MVALYAVVMAALEAMTPEESLWLAVVTLTTIGYGDVVARRWRASSPRCCC